MLSLRPAMKVFVCTEPVDCRRSFDGLARAVEEVIRRSPMSGHLFVFRNRAGDWAKVLWWDRSGILHLVQTTGAGRVPVPGAVAGACSAELLVAGGDDVLRAQQRGANA